MGGTFDIIHIGHLSLIEKAASISEKVIIGLTSDSLATKNGKNLRNNFETRLNNLKKTLTEKFSDSLFEIARYSGIKPKVVDEFGMEMIDGSYNIWCVEAINNLHEVEMELNKGLKEGKVSRFTNIFGMRSSK